MNHTTLRTLANQGGLRIALAVLLIMVGLAPIGAPILSDSAWRSEPAPAVVASPAPAAQAMHYRMETDEQPLTHIERSTDGGRTWQPVAGVPGEILELSPVRGNESTLYARTASYVWVSRDGAATWEQAGALPSRPMSIAVTSADGGAIFAGTESAGLFVSRDAGATWQPVEDAALTLAGAAPVAVTALNVHPDDDSIVYAATAVWVGTSSARLTPVGAYMSVDGGRSFLQVAELPLSGGPATAIRPVDGRPAAVQVTTGADAMELGLGLTPELLAGLESSDAVRRASTVRAVGLLRDSTAAPLLLGLLDDGDGLVGLRVAEALGGLGDPTIAPDLVAALASNQAAVRERAAHALGLMKHEAAVSDLAVLLRSDEPGVARRAAEALANIGTEDALAALTVPLADAEMTPARHAAMIGLELAGTDAAGTLTDALDASSAVVRANAAEMLGWIKAPGTEAALASAMRDGEPAVRVQAAWALGEIATPAARDILVEASISPVTDAATQRVAAEAVERSAGATAVEESAGTYGRDLLSQLSRVPATSWTFSLLALALAIALLLMKPARTAPVRHP